MDKKRANRFDALFDKLLSTDKSIADLQTLGESPNAVEFATFLTTKYLDLQALEMMYKQKLLPALREAHRENIRDARYSRYKEFISFEQEPTEDIDEWVRYGYVQLFHKYESFHRGFIKRLDELYLDILDGRESISEFILKRWHIKIADQWRLDPVVWASNYVTICVKHHDGFPKADGGDKPWVPHRFRKLDPALKLSFEPNEFYADINHIMKWEQTFVQILIGIQNLRLAEPLLAEEPVGQKAIEARFKILQGRVALEHLMLDFRERIAESQKA